MKKRQPKPGPLIVSEEAIQDFARLSVSQRLEWLDQTRSFLSKALPRKTKKIFEEFREKGWQ